MVSKGELPATLMLLILATIETTSSLLSNGLLALLKSPDQRDKLTEDPSLLKNAVEEMLRYDAPAQFINRIAREDVEVGGVRIQAGQNILAVIGAANRDPRVFPEPDTFDIERPNAIRHLAFGGGAHHCAGAPLARDLGTVVFEKLLPHLSRIELAGSVESWQTMTLMFRRLTSLRVEFR
jgi:cytochrome P450